MNTFFKAIDNPLVDAEEIVKGAVIEYVRGEQRKAREAEEKRRLEEQEVARIAAEARKAQEKDQASGELAGKEATVEAEVVAEVIAAPAATPVSATMRTTSGTATVKENWQFEVTDITLVPAEFLKVDEAALRQVVKRLKGDTTIPGVRAFDAGTVTVR